LISGRIPERAFVDGAVLGTTTFQPPFKWSRQLDLNAAAEAQTVGIVLKLLKRPGTCEGAGAKRGVAYLSMGRDPGSKCDPSSGADTVLSVRFDTIARTTKAVWKLGRAAAGRVAKLPLGLSYGCGNFI